MTEHSDATGNCDEALHELYGFLDGELTPERRSIIGQHLSDCSPCLESFDFEAELKIVISQKCRDEVPDALKARIAGALGLAL